MWKIILDAYHCTPNIYRSIAGLPTSTDDCGDGELSRCNWTIGEVFVLLRTLFVPTLPIRAPPFVPEMVRKIIFGSSSTILVDDDSSPFSDDTWVYINGIMSNRKVIEHNRQRLRSLFGRPIDVVHNSSDSLMVDLLESWIGKKGKYLTEPASLLVRYLMPRLLHTRVTRIVLIAHSQGTLVVSQALAALSDLGMGHPGVQYMFKLEVYAFANCASKMCFLIDNDDDDMVGATVTDATCNTRRPNQSGRAPYMESFANEHDIVARFGCTARDVVQQQHDMRIDGDVWIAKGQHGHMFNTHYLHHRFQVHFPRSRLCQYLSEHRG